jgi:tetratricopeptide (TPR) repeat protein
MRCGAEVILLLASWLFSGGLLVAHGCIQAGEKATAEILRCHENGCAEGTLECGGLTPPSPLCVYALGTPRRRQAAALQGASRIFMHGGEPEGHEVYAQDNKADRLFYAFSSLPVQSASPAQTQPLPGVAEAVNKGFDLLSRNDAAGAEAAFRKAIDLQPELEMAHRGLGLALRARGQDEAALRELQVATRLDASDADAHYALAMTAWALSNQSSASSRARGAPPQDYAALAAGEFRKLATLRPRDASVREILTEIDLQGGRKEDALSEAQEAVRLAPDNSRAHVALGRAYFAGAEEDKAAAEYQKALELNPKEGEAFLALGQIRFFQRRYVQAAEYFQRAIQVSPNLAPAYAGMAKLFLQQGRSAEARNMLEKVVALDPQDWQSQYQLAVLLNEAGEAGSATDLLEKVARLHPDFLPAQEQLVMGLVRRGDLKKAGAMAGALIAAQPQAPEGHRLQALILRRQHDLEGALAEAAMALGPEPDSASMLALQAISLWQLKRKKDALAAFREAWKLEPKVGTAEVFCRLVLCDAADIGTVSDFLHRNRWVLAPTPAP